MDRPPRRLCTDWWNSPRDGLTWLWWAARSRRLYQQQNVIVLPGSYLSRDTAHGNPGSNQVRIALVAPLDECVEAARRIRAFVEQL